MFNSRNSASYDYTQAIAPAADRTTTQTSAAIDMTDAIWAQVHVNYGVITDGTFLPSVTDCTTSGGSYVANTECLVGTATAGTSAADETIVTFDIDPAKANRYVKIVLTASGGPATGGVFAVTVATHKKTLT